VARFIEVVVEYPDPNDEFGTKALKSKRFYFSPLKVQFLKEFKDILHELGKSEAENDKRVKEDPSFVTDPFKNFEKIGDLLYRLVTVKHKKMTREEFEEEFAISDYKSIFQKLAPTDMGI